MQEHDIVVIGGSAGSLEPLREIIAGLPQDFPASIFVVVHLSADFPSVLDEVASRWGPMPAHFAKDCETLQPGSIYFAPPDHHLLIENGKVRIERGPRENRHRPAIDPLFRTAARVYGPRVIGIILSGLRDDGSAGLYAIKQRGGVAIVQDPENAAWSEMPRGALKYSRPQFVLQPGDIVRTLMKLVVGEQDESMVSQKQPSNKKSGPSNSSPVSDHTDENLHNAYSDEGEGKPSVFACPECHGVLWELKEGSLTRFRCRVGHSYGSESLAGELSQASESALWAAMRALEEKASLQRRVAESLPSGGHSAKRLLDQCAADDTNARLIRDMIFQPQMELDKSIAGNGSKEEEKQSKKIA